MPQLVTGLIPRVYKRSPFAAPSGRRGEGFLRDAGEQHVRAFQPKAGAAWIWVLAEIRTE